MPKNDLMFRVSHKYRHLGSPRAIPMDFKSPYPSYKK